MKYFFFILLLILPLNAQIKDYKITPPDTLHVRQAFKQKIKILDVKELLFDTKKGVPFCEISDLAYDKGFVYFVSDQGYLYKFFIHVTKNRIENLKYLNAYVLRNRKKEILSKKKRDAEGLALYGNKLLISFERKQRVSVYSKQGVKIKKIKLHPDLEEKDNYVKKNKGLEAVTFSKKYGVICAPELPLKISDGKHHTLYTKSNTYKFDADGSIVSLEFFNQDTILVLLRKYNRVTCKGITALVKVYLNECNKERVCKSEVLAKLDTARGWKIDNFEGLTRVAANKYLMVSDDNENICQKTLLVLFEIKD